MGFKPFENKPLKFAMLGMVDGNGHPYSWSAIMNGFNKEAMEGCPYAGIPQYLFREPEETLRIPNVEVTHIWTDDPKDAALVSKASKISNILEKPEDAIGKVDAVIIATDIGSEHVERCRPFVEAGIPIFVDKPMVDNDNDLEIFEKWIQEGATIISSSCMRYAKEYMPYRISTNDLGELRLIVMTMAKTWERYGIHALEGVYPILGKGFKTVRCSGANGHNIVHLEHEKNVDVVLTVIEDLYGGFGTMHLAGTQNNTKVQMNDTFYAFKAQLNAFVEFLRTGEYPFDFKETKEMMKIIIAGIKSKNAGGAKITL